jgi:hypothetical protein
MNLREFELHGNTWRSASHAAVEKSFQTPDCAPKYSGSRAKGFPRFDVQECHSVTIITNPLVPRVRTKSDSISTRIQDCQSSHVVGNGQERLN